MLIADKIQARLDPALSAAAADLEVFQTISSTNDYLLTQAKQQMLPQNRICFAEEQTQGRGRQGRKWVGGQATNLTFSLLWYFSKATPALSSLSLVLALKIVSCLKRYHPLPELGVKWPNDVVWQGQKIAGILIETATTPPTLNASLQASENPDIPLPLVMGFGFNVKMPAQVGETINQAWTDLSTLLGRDIDRNILAADLLNDLYSGVAQFQTQGFQPFLSEWKKYDLTLGKEIILSRSNSTLTGKCLGVDITGCLLVEQASGEILRFPQGEISLRVALKA